MVRTDFAALLLDHAICSSLFARTFGHSIFYVYHCLLFYSGREHFRPILEDGKRPNSCVVSLGDLGESKSVDQTKQLFAGTY